MLPEISMEVGTDALCQNQAKKKLNANKILFSLQLIYIGITKTF
jgi:hypothetical protein